MTGGIDQGAFSEDLNCTVVQRLPTATDALMWKNVNLLSLTTTSQQPSVSTSRDDHQASLQHVSSTSPARLKQMASRRLEILIDYIALHSRLFSSHLLSGGYQGHLSTDEQELIQHLEELTKAMHRDEHGRRERAEHGHSTGNLGNKDDIFTRVVSVLESMFRRIGYRSGVS